MFDGVVDSRGVVVKTGIYKIETLLMYSFLEVFVKNTQSHLRAVIQRSPMCV